MNAMVSSGLARLASFVPTAVATLLTSRLIIGEFGVESFGSYALVLALISLVTVNSIGVGAAITSAYAESGASSEHAYRVTLTAVRAGVVAAGSLFILVLVITLLEAWPSLLGEASGPNLYSGLSLMIFAASFVPGLAQSMLLGVNRNHVVVYVQTLFTPLIAVLVVGVVALNADSDLVMLAPPAALLGVNLFLAALAGRRTGITWTRLAREVPNRSMHRGTSIRAISGPYFLISLITPIGLYSDRIVLSHLSTAEELARYTVNWQVFAPGLALIAASAQPLWPIFAAARAGGKKGPSVGGLMLLFLGGGAVLSAVLALLAGPVARLVGGGQTDLDPLLPVLGGLVVLTSALAYPVTMSLMDPQGLWVLLWLSMASLPINIGISIALAPGTGAAGPLVGTLIAGLAVQTLPAAYYSLRRERRWRGERESSDRPPLNVPT